jgi:hypothetical protein
MRCFCPQQVGQDLVGRALALQPGGYRLVAPAILRPSARIASIISCRCIEASHRIVARAVRDRRMTELEINDHVQSANSDGGSRYRRARMLRITSSLTAPLSSASDRGLDRFQTIGHYGCQYAHEAAVGFVTAAELAPQPRQVPVAGPTPGSGAPFRKAPGLFARTGR